MSSGLKDFLVLNVGQNPSRTVAFITLVANRMKERFKSSRYLSEREPVRGEVRDTRWNLVVHHGLLQMVCVHQDVTESTGVKPARTTRQTWFLSLQAVLIA